MVLKAPRASSLTFSLASRFTSKLIDDFVSEDGERPAQRLYIVLATSSLGVKRHTMTFCGPRGPFPKCNFSHIIVCGWNFDGWGSENHFLSECKSKLTFCTVRIRKDSGSKRDKTNAGVGNRDKVCRSGHVVIMCRWVGDLAILGI